MSTPKLAVPPPLRGADAGSFAEHSIVHRLPHIAQRVVADNPLTAAMRHQIADLIATIPHRTLEAFIDPGALDMPGWHDYVQPYLGQVVFQKWRWPFLHRPPKGIAVDEQANHDVMHLRGFREADRLAD
jgi:hypothetical protein